MTRPDDPAIPPCVRRRRPEALSALYDNVAIATVTTLRRSTSRLLDRAAGGGVVIVRRNDEPVAALIGYAEFARLQEAEARLERLEGFPFDLDDGPLAHTDFAGEDDGLPSCRHPSSESPDRRGTEAADAR